MLMAADWSGWWLLKVGVSVAISSYFSPLNFWLHWDFVVAHGLSLVAESRSYSLAVVHGLFIVLPPLVVKCGLWDLWAPRTGPGVVVHKLSCPAVYGIFLDHGLNHCPLHLQGRFLTTGLPSAQPFSHAWLLAATWTVTCQAPLSMGFSRREYWTTKEAQFLKLRQQWTLPHRLPLPFTDSFSVACTAVR